MLALAGLYLQGVLTPSWVTVVLHPLGGVRKQCSQRCLPTVTAWLAEYATTPNIVITDFTQQEVVKLIIDKNTNSNCSFH